MKKIIKFLIEKLIFLLSRLKLNYFLIYLVECISKYNYHKIIYKKKFKLKFFTPSTFSKWRSLNIYKEIEINNWIETFSKKEIFFDIGSNIGIYSIICGKKKMNVFSFEPDYSNLFVLQKNIVINNLSKNITLHES